MSSGSFVSCHEPKGRTFSEVLQLQRWGSGRVSEWVLAGHLCSTSANLLPRLSLPCDGTFGSHSASGTWKSLLAERGLSLDHTTIWRWTQTYAPEVQRRLRGVKRKASTWHMDETFVRISGRWM